MNEQESVVTQRYAKTWFIWPLGMIINAKVAPVMAAQANVPVAVMFILNGAILGLASGIIGRPGDLPTRIRASWMHAVWPVVVLGIWVAALGVPTF